MYEYSKAKGYLPFLPPKLKGPHTFTTTKPQLKMIAIGNRALLIELIKSNSSLVFEILESVNLGVQPHEHDRIERMR